MWNNGQKIVTISTFSGEQHFKPDIPCVPTELVAFRQRIGEPGVELILQESIRVNEPPEDMSSGLVISGDTTVKKKNITCNDLILKFTLISVNSI